MSSACVLMGALLVLLAPPLAAAESTPAAPGVAISIDNLVRAADGLGFVTGRAVGHKGALSRFDIAFLIDVSGSTADASGSDIDGDGKRGGGILGLGRASLGDSVLAAELAAVRALLRRFDPRNTRVALVTFSGGTQRGADNASIEVELTSQFVRVRNGLKDILSAGPGGATDMRAGLRMARVELRRSNPSVSGPRQAIVVLLTDGEPMVPREDPEVSTQRAIQMAGRLARNGITVHTYAIGRKATRRPRAAVEIARRTGGVFTAVEDPAKLESMLGEMPLNRIEALRVRNLTTGSAAVQQLLKPDGRYSALVPLGDGANTIESWARSETGAEARATHTLDANGLRLAPEDQAALRLLLGRNARDSRDRQRELEIGSDEAE